MYDTVDGINNRSDHVAVKCTLHFKVAQYVQDTESSSHSSNVNWKHISFNDIELYRQKVDEYLKAIDIHMNAIQCKSQSCQVHREEINDLHDAIIQILLRASDDSLPTHASRH